MQLSRFASGAVPRIGALGSAAADHRERRGGGVWFGRGGGWTCDELVARPGMAYDVWCVPHVVHYAFDASMLNEAFPAGARR
mgnify:CR=1 FL=1